MSETYESMRGLGPDPENIDFQRALENSLARSSAIPIPSSDDNNPTRAAYLAARRVESDQRDSVDEEAPCPHGAAPVGEFEPDTAPVDFKSESSPSSNLVPKRKNIDDCIKELQNVYGNALPRRGAIGADTAVFIDPPAKDPGISDRQHSEVCAYYGEPFYVRSDNLLKASSERFEHELGPTSQFRIMRRRAKEVKEIQHNFPNITKFIDLTPKTEGLDAVEMVMELSCPKGVLLWGMAVGRWGVTRSLVAGEDEFAAKKPIGLPSPDRTSQSLLSEPTSFDAASLDRPFDYPMPAEYSSIRHRACIERVLLALEGMDPVLDSAPKMYSVAILAKSYGILQSPLTDYIVRWIRAYPNSVFIEVLPEVTLKIAECLQCESLARDAFAILVGESALEMQVERTGVIDRIQKGRTVYHRRKEDIDEIWQNRIQYARLSFTERIQTGFDNISKGNMSWVEELPQFKLISRYDYARTSELDDFKQALKEFVRSVVYYHLCGTYLFMNEREVRKRPGAEQLFPSTRLKDTWDTLLPYERIFTRSFWELLEKSNFENIQLTDDVLNLPITYLNYGTHSQSAYSSRFEAAGIFRPVKMTQLVDLRKRAWDSVNPQRFNLQENVDSSNIFQFGSSWTSAVARSPALPIRTAAQSSGFSQGSNSGGDTVSIGAIRNNLPVHTNPDTLEVSLQPSQPQTGHNDLSNPNNPRDLRWSYGNSSMPHNPFSLTPASHYNDPRNTRFDNFFDFHNFFRDVKQYFARKSTGMLALTEGSDWDAVDMAVTNVLLSLDESEIKYLPLWAGGFDDNSGGVFNSEVPLTDNGFAGAGPHGIRGVNSSRGSSEFSMIDGESSAGTSALVNDGYSDAMDRRRVYTPSGTPSSGDTESIDWNMVRNHKEANEGTFMSDAGDETMAGNDDDFDLVTPTGTKNAPAPDPKQINEALRKQKAAAEEDDFGDIFIDNPDEDNLSDEAMADCDSDEEPMGGEAFTEVESYHGFDSTSAATTDISTEIPEDRGENYGQSHGKGKGKATDVVPGSIADQGRAYNPTYVYKDGPEDMMDEHRP